MSYATYNREELPRISPSYVLRIYETYHLRPVTGTMGGPLTNNCCCPMGAMASACGIKLTGDRWTWAFDTYGDRYAYGFIHGFDCIPKDWKVDKRYLLGYVDGQETHKLIAQHFGKVYKWSELSRKMS